MADREWGIEVDKLDSTLRSIEAVLNIVQLEKDAISLEAEASAPNLWDDPEKAQVVTSKLSRVQATLNKLKSIRGRLDDIPVLVELAQSENDSAALKDASSELDSITKDIDELEVQTLLNGE